MVIPKYIKAMMGRARFTKGFGDPGYTVETAKSTPYTTAETFKREVERLCAWAERQMPRDEFSIPTAVINNIPHKTQSDFKRYKREEGCSYRRFDSQGNDLQENCRTFKGSRGKRSSFQSFVAAVSQPVLLRNGYRLM